MKTLDTPAMCSLGFVLLLCVASTCAVNAQTSNVLPAPRSQDEKMAWFREAKFGLFIHWGLYAIPPESGKASARQA